MTDRMDKKPADTQKERVCPDSLRDHYRALVAEKCPVVQCITNIVTVNDCANALLAVGASPTMAHHPQEMLDFSRICDALVCNMGATESLEAMMIAAKTAHEKGHPVVIDPVGCAGSPFRRERCMEVIERAHAACIRGNHAEILALAGHCNTGRGVDDSAPENGKSMQLSEAAADLSGKTGAIVIASGKVDLLFFKEKRYEVHAGSAWLKKLTGAGCMLSSLLGAFLAADNSPESAWACCTFMAQCGEAAERASLKRDAGMGTFHMLLLDELSRSAAGKG